MVADAAALPLVVLVKPVVAVVAQLITVALVVERKVAVQANAAWEPVLLLPVVLPAVVAQMLLQVAKNRGQRPIILVL